MPKAKLREQLEAQRLRRTEGMPMKQIAARLGVSPSSVHAWTKDIEITERQRGRNLREAGARRAEQWVALNREKRQAYQYEGRVQARREERLHEAGCMLYWAEGAKSRGELTFCNSDRAMIGLFWRFLSTYFEFESRRVSIRLNVYLNNGLSIEEVEDWWNEVLALPRKCFRNHVIDHYPTSSSGQRSGRLPYGVCTIRLTDTPIVQHILGAIQEYGHFEEPRWLDGPPRKPRSRPASG